MDTIRKPIIAGTWYPADSSRLRADVEGYLADARVDVIDGKVVGVISPHAGYVYSGQVAAHAYKAAQGGAFDAVILIGPSHRAYFKGASIFNGEGYETPLGIVPVDRALADNIAAYSSGVVSLVPDDRLPENSLEIQVPFLQVAFGPIPFVPILMGTQDLGTCRAVADAIIRAVGDGRVLLVASSDFSHYHSYDRAVEMDSMALGYIEKMDAEGFLRGIEDARYEACGAGPVVVTTMVTRAMGADTARILEYKNSGDITGDKSGVVGYAAVVLYQKNAGDMDQWGNAGDGFDETGTRSAPEDSTEEY
ncbi:MAG: AmmeMemoRadiSam system protein B [Deltaproteobacteria bacterium]|nr:AmmeMemoRadiSam system protein B [Deltaproteobacteria bacterium]